jgi:hypothetical protein
MATGSNDADNTSRNGSEAASASGIRRRELLIAGGAVVGAAVITRLERDQALVEGLLGGAGPRPSFTSSLLRPEDMLAFDVEFYYASLQVLGGVPVAHPGDGLGRPDFYMVAVFGPQAIAEEPLSVGSAVPTAPVPAQLSGQSRLAFAVRGSLALSDEALLDFVTLKRQPGEPQPRKRMLLVPSALSAGNRPARATPRQPTRTETAIEAPYRMSLSPAVNGGATEQFWRNRAFPLDNDGRSELWHTRLVNLYCLDDLCTPGDSALNGEETPASEIRAVWTPGWNREPTQVAQGEPFARPMTLTPPHRSEIVSLSSDFGNPSIPNPQTGSARLLALSALGASFDLSFDFPELPGTAFNVTHWSDRATLGREHYIKVVQSGYLFPLGHKASLIEISERQIDVRNGNGHALIRKRQYLVLREKTRQFNSRAFPFASVTVVDDTTPILDPSSRSRIPGLNNKSAAFWPRVGGRDYLWTLTATDVEGIRVEFQAPLIWVNSATSTRAQLGSNEGEDRGTILDYYFDAARAPQRERPFGGQSVAYAPSVAGKVRQTAFATEMFELGAVSAAGTPRFAPRFRSARIATPALAAGLQPPPSPREGRGAFDPVIRVKPAPAYVGSGFSQARNAAQAYLSTTEKVVLDYTKDGGGASTGALGSPNMVMGGLSRTLGPLGGNLPGGTVPELNPADFLKDAKFLGIEFTKVLPASIPLPDPTSPTFAADAAKVPKTLTETIYEGGTGQLARKIPKEIRTEFSWEPQLKGNDVFIPNGPSGTPATMLLRNVTVVPISEQGPGRPRQDTTGEVKNFGLALFGDNPFLIVYFNRFEFRSRNDQKPDVNVDIADVVFSGPLSFVNDLRKLMSSATGGSGLSIDITPASVKAGYSVDFPTITTGIMTIANLSLGAEVEVPFDGNPVVTRFRFCEQKRPFLLTYTIFGGGGYASIGIHSKGLESLIVSLEFGAAAALNLGVASGSVQAMAGIMIKYLPAESKAELSGFVRLRGELDVLGIINVSLEFNLTLSYEPGSGEARGTATLTVEVEVLCFSESVSLSVEKKFKGGGSSRRALGGSAPAPISFGDLYTPEAWDTYRAAFAPQAF